MSNQRSNLLKNRRKYARRRRVKVADLESQSGHASLRYKLGAGVLNVAEWAEELCSAGFSS